MNLFRTDTPNFNLGEYSGSVTLLSTSTNKHTQTDLTSLKQQVCGYSVNDPYQVIIIIIIIIINVFIIIIIIIIIM